MAVSCLLMDLSEAILHEIFCRLPIISIMKLRLVCLPLYNLVSHPDFNFNYSKKYPFTALFSCQYKTNSMAVLRNLSLVEFSDNLNDKFHMSTPFKPKIPGWPDRDACLSCNGTCNGLVCLSLYKLPMTHVVYICNPITAECIAVAKYEIKKFPFVYFGFGFCKSSNNYKVLKIVWNGHGPDEQGEGEILTVGVDDTWRGLDPVANPKIPCGFSLYNSVIFNEVFHCMVSNRICTFDFGEEKIGWLSIPPECELGYLYVVSLKLIRNQLCLVLRSYDVDYDPRKIIIWRMKEYGVAESWTKDMVFDHDVVPYLGGLERDYYLSNLVFDLDMIPYPEGLEREYHLARELENGSMIATCSEFSLLFDPTKGEPVKIKFPCSGCIDYSPSFLSPKEIMKGARSRITSGLSK